MTCFTLVKNIMSHFTFSLHKVKNIMSHFTYSLFMR